VSQITSCHCALDNPHYGECDWSNIPKNNHGVCGKKLVKKAKGPAWNKKGHKI